MSPSVQVGNHSGTNVCLCQWFTLGASRLIFTDLLQVQNLLIFLQPLCATLLGIRESQQEPRRERGSWAVQCQAVQCQVAHVLVCFSCHFQPHVVGLEQADTRWGVWSVILQRHWLINSCAQGQAEEGLMVCGGTSLQPSAHTLLIQPVVGEWNLGPPGAWWSPGCDWSWQQGCCVWGRDLGFPGRAERCAEVGGWVGGWVWWLCPVQTLVSLRQLCLSPSASLG